ncbi:MAG: glycosyltransferase family 2 protein [Waddliaceae bacterium]
MNSKPSIGVVVITHNAKKHLPRCLPPFLESPLNPRVLVVNSSSADGTVETAQELGAETLVIPRQNFNHGSTRETARKHLHTDIIVMVTPDAYAADNHVLEQLVTPILHSKTAISYARQIPHDGADFFESFPRTFNYPAENHVRGIEDAGKYGIYTFFCSNSCAAYSNHALDEIGGFESVLIGEDTVAVAKLLRKGHKIAYVADAVVKHSHRYSLLQEFQRHFDTGLARKDYRYLISLGGSDTTRGTKYVREMTKYLLRKKPHLLPYAFTQTLVKWLGYKIGCHSAKAPVRLKKAFSGQDFYWASKDFLKKKQGEKPEK